MCSTRCAGSGEFGDLENPTLRNLNDLIVQTGLRASRTTLALWFFALCAAYFALFMPLFGIGVRSLAFALVLAPLTALVVLRVLRSRRIARFAAQLPDAVDIIVRGVRVGHPFSVAINLVAREMPDPIGSEFGITADEITFGQDVSTAVANLYRRVGQDDLLYLVIVVNIQTQSGGNLATILSRLSKLIWERAKVRLKVKALSAEGRMSGWLLTAMPFLLFAVIKLMAPNYFDEFVAHPIFEPAVAGGIVSLLVGNVMIYRMVNFKF